MSEKWNIIGHDYGSYLLRNFIAVRGYNNFKQEIGIHSSGFAIAAQKGDIVYLYKASQLKKSHTELKELVMKDIKFIRKLVEKTNKYAEEAVSCSEKVFNSDIRRKSGKELMADIRKLSLMQSKLYTMGVLLPVLDFQHNKFIEDNLRNFLSSKVDKRKADEYFHLFTMPARDSFGMIQDKALLKLMEKHDDDNLWQLVKDNEPDDALIELVKEKYPSFYMDLAEHTKKYCWVYYVYSGPAFKEANFLEFIKSNIVKGIEPVKELERLEKEKKRIADEKEKIISELNPDNFYNEILRLAGLVIWAKPTRKDYQSKLYYHLIEGLLKEVSRRLMISRNQVLSCPFDIMEKGLVDGELDIDDINVLNRIYMNHAVVSEGDEIKIYHGNYARKISDEIDEKEDKIDYDIRELKGTSACKGIVNGVVKIINVPADMHKMNEGDVLVSTATTPSIVSAMKKASAIVTDEGGITCHASIVSRELGIPCVVGTEIASRVFKDGDKIVVDADNGIVKKVNIGDAWTVLWCGRPYSPSLMAMVTEPCTKEFPKYIGVEIPIGLNVYSNKMDSFMFRTKDLISGGKKLIEKFRKGEFYKNNFEMIYRLTDELDEASLELIRNISVKSNDELIESLRRVFKMFKAFYVEAFVPIYLESGENLLSKESENVLRKRLKELGKDDKFAQYYVDLLTPSAMTLNMREELDFLKMIEKIGNKDIEIIKNHSLFRAHIKKWKWISFDLFDRFGWDENTYLQRLKETIKTIDVHKKINEIENYETNVLKRFNEIASTLNFDQESLNIINITRKYGEVKEYRKVMILLYCYRFFIFIKELARRVDTDYHNLQFMLFDELLNIFKDSFDWDVVKERMKECIVVTENGSSRIITGNEARDYKKKIIINEGDSNVDVLHGMPAYIGKVKGTVRIVNTIMDAEKMKKGDILVSISTFPELVPVMKNAGAIVTDDGGITCHAAIVSRELKIPCVIGTKVATKALKDGDLVEVDAAKGEVRKIK